MTELVATAERLLSGVGVTSRVARLLYFDVFCKFGFVVNACDYYIYIHATLIINGIQRQATGKLFTFHYQRENKPHYLLGSFGFYLGNFLCHN